MKATTALFISSFLISAPMVRASDDTDYSREQLKNMQMQLWEQQRQLNEMREELDRLKRRMVEEWRVEDLIRQHIGR